MLSTKNSAVNGGITTGGEQYISIPGERLAAGDKLKVVNKIAPIDQELGGVLRIYLQMAVEPVDRENRLSSVERQVELAKYIGV